jgi:hypothetical protein
MEGKEQAHLLNGLKPEHHRRGGVQERILGITSSTIWDSPIFFLHYTQQNNYHYSSSPCSWKSRPKSSDPETISGPAFQTLIRFTWGPRRWFDSIGRCSALRVHLSRLFAFVAHYHITLQGASSAGEEGILLKRQLRVPYPRLAFSAIPSFLLYQTKYEESSQQQERGQVEMFRLWHNRPK